MPRFYVAPAHVPLDEFYDAASDIEVVGGSHPNSYAKRAAEFYVEDHLADLDYPQEIDIRVRPSGGGEFVYDVTVRSVHEAHAKLKEKADG